MDGQAVGQAVGQDVGQDVGQAGATKISRLTSTSTRNVCTDRSFLCTNKVVWNDANAVDRQYGVSIAEALIKDIVDVMSSLRYLPRQSSLS